jgi:hypothetical protein
MQRHDERGSVFDLVLCVSGVDDRITSQAEAEHAGPPACACALTLKTFNLHSHINL